MRAGGRLLQVSPVHGAPSPPGSPPCSESAGRGSHWRQVPRPSRSRSRASASKIISIVSRSRACDGIYLIP